MACWGCECAANRPEDWTCGDADVRDVVGLVPGREEERLPRELGIREPNPPATGEGSADGTGEVELLPLPI